MRWLPFLGNLWLTELSKSSSGRYYSCCCSFFSEKIHSTPAHRTNCCSYSDPVFLPQSALWTLSHHLLFITYTSTDMRSFTQHNRNWNTPKTANVPEQIHLNSAPINPMPALYVCLHFIITPYSWY